MVTWRLVSRARLASTGEWFNRNAVSAILASRFLPGMRLSTYFGAGVLRISPKFLAIALSASITWALLLLSLTARLGAVALERVGAWKAPLGLGLAGLIAVRQWISARRRRRAMDPPSPDNPAESSVFEFWPPALFVIPGAPWLWQSVGIPGRRFELPAFFFWV
ncbi:MAG: DedA family protein [Thermoanaerobaculaceae bacterium]